MDRRREGFFEPKYCPRERTDCLALAQIIAVNHESFMCCGERQDEPAQRHVPQDAYRFCHKSCEGVDVMMNHDERDMAHIAAVYTWATAATMPYHGEPRQPVLAQFPLQKKPPNPQAYCPHAGTGECSCNENECRASGEST